MVFSKVLIFILALCFSTGSAIKCFQCSSRDEGCDNLLSNDTQSVYLKECEGKDFFCRKTVQTIVDSNMFTIINRECGWSLNRKLRTNSCYQNDDEFKHEKSCQCFEEGCNHSSIPNPSTTLFTSLLILYLYLNH
ncbi:PREDICTED: uncharacterized protein LOC108567003 [Nicrophorus vespilloides]|uniref:Uncharacterized protein LOC108567003 n=1 Tax=Nicrophorus vespilloides TaxID=110193 RepID=A0ABM1N766_NICVS|nr:PREDICTED: uncharacterized protein LOC108567003 [Nicrophorus vespilloides]